METFWRRRLPETSRHRNAWSQLVRKTRATRVRSGRARRPRRNGYLRPPASPGVPRTMRDPEVVFRDRLPLLLQIKPKPRTHFGGRHGHIQGIDAFEFLFVRRRKLVVGGKWAGEGKSHEGPFIECSGQETVHGRSRNRHLPARGAASCSTRRLAEHPVHHSRRRREGSIGVVQPGRRHRGAHAEPERHRRRGG